MPPTIAKQQMLDAYNSAPKAVRDAFNSEQTAAVIRSIQSQYQLHMDVAGELQQHVGYMLLGLISPTDLFSHIVSRGVPQDAARLILETLNQRIFMPLQERMRSEEDEELDRDYIPYGELEKQEKFAQTTTTQESSVYSYPQPPAASVPTTVSGVSIPQITSAAAGQHLAEAPVGIPQNLITNPPVMVTQPLVRTMGHDIELLQHPELVGHPTPASSFQTASIPVTSVPVPWMGSAPQAQTVGKSPVPPPPPQIQQAMARQIPPIQTLPGTNSPVPVKSEPLVQKHTGDPYREPID